MLRPILNSASTHRARALVMFHCYQWDAFTQRQAAALEARSRGPGIDFMVLADETDGMLPVRSYRKFAHQKSIFAAAGLPVDDGLWWNLDYAVADAATSLPGYDFYFRFDADVRITIDLATLAEHMHTRGLDWLSLPPRPTAGWAFEESCAGLPYAERRYVPIMALMLSRRFAMLLGAERRIMAAAHTPGTPWPFCEAFVASCARHHRLRFGNLSHVVDATLFRAELGLLEDDARVQAPGAFFHAVLDPPRYRSKLQRMALHCVRGNHVAELEYMRAAGRRYGWLPEVEAAMAQELAVAP